MTTGVGAPHRDFIAATRQHLQHDIEVYTACFSQAAEGGAGVDWTQADIARDRLLKTLELAATTAKAAERGGDAVTLEALTDAWLRAHRG